MPLRRRGLAALAPLAAVAQPPGDPVRVGVSGPLSGQYAQYGADWRRGFDLALAEVFPADPRPAVQRFVQAFKAAYGGEPGFYAARGYDAMTLAAAVPRQDGTTRQAVHDGLARVRDVPSVLFGTVQFDPATRRVRHPASVDLVVRDGAFVLRDGKPAAPL